MLSRTGKCWTGHVLFRCMQADVSVSVIIRALSWRACWPIACCQSNESMLHLCILAGFSEAHARLLVVAWTMTLPWVVLRAVGSLKGGHAIFGFDCGEFRLCINFTSCVNRCLPPCQNRKGLMVSFGWCNKFSRHIAFCHIRQLAHCILPFDALVLILVAVTGRLSIASEWVAYSHPIEMVRGGQQTVICDHCNTAEQFSIYKTNCRMCTSHLVFLLA